MCLAAFALRAHPRFAWVVATNRDEFYARPTRPAQWWAVGPGGAPAVWAGRDEQGGGTWMGVTKAGRFALLTNVREPAHQRADAVTRGALVAGYVEGREQPGAYLARVARHRDRYNGFNLVCGQLQAAPAFWALHHGHGPMRGSAGLAGQVVPVADGLHGLSNAALGTPWPKTTGLVQDVDAALRQHEATEPLSSALFDALADRRRAPDEALPDTGVGLEWERRLSARFIAGGAYGTRASTVLLLGTDGQLCIEERTFGPGGVSLGRRRAGWTLR